MASTPRLVRLEDVRRAALTRGRDGREPLPLQPEVQRRATESDEALLQGLQERQAWAERALLERYGGHVERVITHVLGSHADLDDLAQEVFLRALARVEDLRDARGLGNWLAAFAVFVAREAIRKRRRRWWQVLWAPQEMPELPAPNATVEERAALRAFYDVLGNLEADARVAFALRHVEGMELTQIAEICRVSLATIKRRIHAAEIEFYELGRKNEALADWLEEGTRWPRSS